MQRLVLASFFALGAAAFGCAPPPLPPKKKAEVPMTDPTIDTEKGVDVATARKLLERAEESLRQNEIPNVKRLCEQAEPFADEAVREEIRSLLQRADQRVAKDLAPVVLELAKSGECQKAAEMSLAIVEEHRGTTVARFLRDEVSKPILTCLLDALAIDVSVARELSEAGALKKALNPVDFDLWDAKLDEAIVGSLVVGLKAPMAARQWGKAGKLLDEMVARKEAGPKEVERVMKVIRAGVVEDIRKKSAAGIGVKLGAAQLVKDIDGLIEAGRWSEADPVPDELEQHHREAAFWSICAAQDCTLIAPQQVWAFGKLEPRPVLDVSGKPTDAIKHARRVWKLTEGRALALITDHDPGPLDGVAARIPVGIGWVPVMSLATADTAERLPPGDAIVGTRVWGGLRDKAKEWELGTVLDAKNDVLTIERASDGKSVTARRSEVRFGTLRKGTKVLAMCAHPIKLEPAMIESVTPISATDARVAVTCLDAKGDKGVAREVLLGSLRSQSAWIPLGN